MSIDGTISARALASRRNGTRSRGPKTREGKARSARNALKHGMRAAKYVILPDEDAAEFAAHEAALMAELAPLGALQTVLARRVAVAAWRLGRADRIEADLFKERHHPNGGPGLAVIRDGNGTRSFETLLRYRGAAMAEFWRALRTLKALQAEQAKPAEDPAGATLALASPDSRAAARPMVAHSAKPNEPKRGASLRLHEVTVDPGAPGRALHESAAPWLPNEPEAGSARHAPAAPASRTNPQLRPLVGQTVAADGAPASAVALLQSMPDVGPC